MYETDRLWLSATVPRVQGAVGLVDEFVRNVGVSGRDALRVCLLAEETVGMVCAMVEDFEAELWLTGDRASCAIILEARARIGGGTDPELISAASGGENARAPRGFMAKIARMLSCSFFFENEDEVPDFLLDAIPDYMSYGMSGASGAAVMAGKWSLNTYRERLKAESARDPATEDALDELEKSIVAKIADDVTVGVRGEKIRLVITKNFGNDCAPARQAGAAQAE